MLGGSGVRAAASGIAVLALGIAGAWAAGPYLRGASPAGIAGRGHVIAATSVPQPCKSGTCYVAVNVATVWVRTVYPRPGWSKVAVSRQPTPRDSRGYPGYVPTRQLTNTAPASASTSAVVRTKTAWLWSAWTSAGLAG